MSWKATRLSSTRRKITSKKVTRCSSSIGVKSVAEACWLHQCWWPGFEANCFLATIRQCQSRAPFVEGYYTRRLTRGELFLVGVPTESTWTLLFLSNYFLRDLRNDEPVDLGATTTKYVRQKYFQKTFCDIWVPTDVKLESLG